MAAGIYDRHVFDANNAPYSGVVPLTPGTPTASVGRSLGIVCTVAGNVAMTLQDGSIYVVPVAVEFQTLPFAVTQVNTSGTTATATYANLL